MKDLADKLLNGDRRALARSITYIENNHELSKKIIDSIFSSTGKAHIIGITGPPGAGKSSLVDRLIGKYREIGKSVGVIAVDPTSPFTGGAILGDRIRMLQYTSDDGVYIRSMASRGNLGGLSAATFDTMMLMDAYGFDKIIIETVGAGQSEVDIVSICDTTIVLTVPDFGDDIQVLKAGVMEIADIFVVNKSDKDGAKELGALIHYMLEMDETSDLWKSKICLTSTLNGEGINTLISEIENHFNFLLEGNKKEGKRKNNLMEHFRIKINDLLSKNFTSNENYQSLKNQIDDLINEKTTYSQTLEKLVEIITHDIKLI